MEEKKDALTDLCCGDQTTSHERSGQPVVDENKRVIGIIAPADIATRLAEPEKTAEVVEEISKSHAASG